MRALLLRITGSVQGVSYRAYAKAKADELSITGWARNCDDGSVEIHAEGEDAALQEFVQWCHEGSPAARVENVTQENTLPEEEDDFVTM